MSTNATRLEVWPVPASRLRRCGPPGADAFTWATRLALLALVAAAAWSAWTATRPLPTGLSSDHVSPGGFEPPMKDPRLPAEQRRERLDALAQVNLFAADRLGWSPRAEPPPIDTAAAPGTAPTTGPADLPTNLRVGNASIALTPSSSIPDDVKQALTGLALRAVMISPHGSDEPVALISRVHAGPNPFVADSFRVGDEFEDKQHAQAKWKVEAIDVPAARVYLSRSGATVALLMYSGVSDPSKAAAPGDPGANAATPKPPKVVARSANEVMAELKASGLSDADVARLMELADLPPDQAQSQAALDALAAVQERERAAADKSKRTGPPPGMEKVIEMMRKMKAEQKSQSAESPAPQPPQ